MNDDERLVKISELESWAQTAFVGYKTLNRIQSRIFQVRFAPALRAPFPCGALLVLRMLPGCAPTGADKATSTHASQNQHLHTGFMTIRIPVGLCRPSSHASHKPTPPVHVQTGFTTNQNLLVCATNGDDDTRACSSAPHAAAS